MALLVALLVALFMGSGSGAAVAGGGEVRWILPAGQEARILGLVAPYETQAPVEPGTWFDRIALTPTGMDFVVEGRDPPAAPVTLRVRWSPATASMEIAPELSLTVHGLTDETPDNLARSVELLHDRIDSRLVTTLGPAFLGVAPDDARGEGFLDLADNEAMVRRGITQVTWEAVAETAPEAPGVWWGVLLGAVVMIFGALGLLRRWKGHRGWEAIWGVLLSLGAVAAWWLTGAVSAAGLAQTIRTPAELEVLVPMHRDFALAVVFLIASGVATLVAASLVLRDLLRDRRPAAQVGAEVAAVLGVAAVSLFVRLGLGELNVLTDGGSGFDRVLQYGFGFGGTSLLITGALPASLAGMIWPAVALISVIAGLAPVAMYGLTRELGFSRWPAIAAAAALACWPLHAALFTSDFLQGPVLTVGLVGLWWVARSVRQDRPERLLVGAAIYGGLIWMRPDAMIWALPYAAVAAPLGWKWRTHGGVWAAMGLGALAIGCRLLSYAKNPGILPQGGANVVELTGEGFLLAGHAALPWWLWLGIPAGIPALWSRHRVAALVVFGGLAAYLSLRVGGTPPDLLEFFRYLAPAMAWVSLIVGLGLAWWVERVPAGRARVVAACVVGAALLATPVLHRAYLGTTFGPRVSDQVFRVVLADLPADASIIVPGEARGDGLDPAPRFRYIAWEEFPNREAPVPGNRVVSAAVLLDFVRTDGRLPEFGDLALASGARREGPTRWYYLRTGECLYTQPYDTATDQDPGTCQALEAALEIEVVEAWTTPFRHHRLVSQPGDRALPKYDDDFRTILYRVRGLRTSP